MASIEFIQKRIEGKEKEIEKLNKKLDRINAAKATNWEKNPYWYSERDLTSTEKELAAAQKALEDYRDSLQSAEEKANSRNITAIIKFLNDWKVRVMQNYKESFEIYLKELAEWKAYDKEYIHWANEYGYKLRRDDREAYDRRYKEYKERRDNFSKKWNLLSGLVSYKHVDGNLVYYFEEAKFQKILDEEADAKYDFIVERTNAIVGQITDASGLSVGSKGDLNGIIIGTKGNANVQTIGAGGYAVQVFHFRTLIKPCK